MFLSKEVRSIRLSTAIYCCFSLFAMITQFLLDKSVAMPIPLMFFASLFWASYIIFFIEETVTAYKTYKSLESRFEYLQSLIKYCYMLYPTEIKEYAKNLSDACDDAIYDTWLSKKHTKKVEKIIEETNKLMSTTN